MRGIDPRELDEVTTIERLQRANKDILQVLIKTIETRDPYTSGHSLRVAQLAKAIAEDLELPLGKIDRVYMAALVHDIGKIETVYADIIRKEASLTDTDRRVILTHAAKGAEFLTTLSSFNSEVIAAVKHHHEKYDGQGYPAGLRGDEIPVEARIVAIIDAFDAMTSSRPYRDRVTVPEAIARLECGAGTQFDPMLTPAFIRIATEAVGVFEPAALDA